jgi:hypothetical protein
MSIATARGLLNIERINSESVFSIQGGVNSITIGALQSEARFGFLEPFKQFRPITVQSTPQSGPNRDTNQPNLSAIQVEITEGAESQKPKELTFSLNSGSEALKLEMATFRNEAKNALLNYKSQGDR